MSHFVRCFLLSMLFVTLGHSAVIATTYFEGHTYYLLTAGSWSAKEAEAVALGGHLATIGSAAEDMFIYNSWSTQASIYGLWIGLNDMAVEGQFRWVSGEPVTYLHFPPSEPNGGTNENAVHIQLTNGNWNDNDAASSFQAMAEVAGVPEPSTLTMVGIACLALARVRYRLRGRC